MTKYNVIILQICAASQKKSLAGLDNIATEGSQAFDTVEDVVNRLRKVGKLSLIYVLSRGDPNLPILFLYNAIFSAPLQSNQVKRSRR